MEFSPYLRGIQQVPGKTPGEKFRSLNESVRKIANDASRCQGGPCTPEILPTPDLPEVLIPLVRLEIAKILRQPEEIVAALKSGDSSLVARALTCKWFFNGSLRDYTNAAYFVSHIFPHLSLRNRTKVIRSLAKYLNCQDPTVAEEFYEALSEKYGNKQAEPLLLACRDTFIWSTVETRRLTLSIWTVQRVYRRHPQTIVNYLKFLPTDAFSTRKFTRNLMVKFRKFLPQVFKHSPSTVIDIFLAHKENFGLKLTSKRTRHFFQLSEALILLLAHPDIFLPMLSRKFITKKLTREQFMSILVKILPSNRQMIQNSFESIFEHLEYFPEEEKILLFLSAFEKRYGISYIECNDTIDYEIIVKLLPQTMRVDFARRQVEAGYKFDLYRSEIPCLCYLPTREAIQEIKNQIDVTSNYFSISKLLESLIYTCHVNNDKNALVGVLKYIATRHKNESIVGMCNLFDNINSLFKIDDLTAAHWNWIMQLLYGLYVKNDLPNTIAIQELLMKKIFFNVINHLPTDKDISFFLEVNVQIPSQFYWLVLEDQPLHLQRECLDLIIKAAPSMLNDVKHQEDSWLKLDCNILDNIYEFNRRMKMFKTLEIALKPMSPQNYDWLCEDIRIITSQPELNKHYASIIEVILKRNDPELYTMFLGEEKAIFDVFSDDAVNLLKKNHEKILRNWKSYYQECREYINIPCTRFFIQSCRWYEDIPVKFVEKALADLPDSEDGRELIILALLMAEGKKFEEIIERFIQTNAGLDVDDPNLYRKTSINKSIMIASNVAKALLLLEIYFKHFNDDDPSIAHYHMKNQCEMAKIKDVLGIAEKLMEIPGVSNKKYGIQLFFDDATLDQQMKMMAKLVDTEKQRTTRHILGKIARDNFINQPGPNTFAMMCNCLEKMPLDDRDILRKFVNFDGISDQYIAEYFKIVLAAIDNPDRLIYPDDKTTYISRMIDCASTEIGCFFTEDYHQELLEKYFATLSCKEITFSMCRYLVDNYIGLAGELGFRLNYFSKILTRVLKKHWKNSYHQMSPDCDYPVHWMFQNLTELIQRPGFSKNLHTKLLKILSRIFYDTLKPKQASPSYIRIQLASLEFDDTSAQTAKKIASILSHLVDVFSLSLTSEIAQIIFDTLQTLHSSKNFNSFFLKTVKYLLKYDDQLLMHLCAIWLMKGFFNDFPVDSILTIIQILDRSTSSTVIAALAIYKGKN